MKGKEYGKDTFISPIIERIKTFEDAFNELGEEDILCQNFLQMQDLDLPKNIFAYLKLEIICKVLNEGWMPTLAREEERWYPNFILSTKEEIDKRKGWLTVKMLPHSMCDKNFKGFTFSGVATFASTSSIGVSFALYLKTLELAEYCGKNFIDIWADYLMVIK